MAVVTSPEAALRQRVGDAIVAAFGPEYADADPVIRVSVQPQYGDFQANGAMGLAKRLGRPKESHQIAKEIVAHLGASDLVAKADVAGPGFVNLTVSDEWLAITLAAVAGDERLGVGVVPEPERVVIDYSSPNAAKEMHVGHLRSTGIGDALSRVLEFLGHSVIRQNHLGDWGTQFGMLVENLLESPAGANWVGGADVPPIADLDQLYREASARYQEDEVFAQRARQRVVELQRGDPVTRRVWQEFIAESERHCVELYARLGVKLTSDDFYPESAYNDDLPRVVEELLEKKIAVVDDGAVCVFVPGVQAPMIIQKSDGGYLYATTDLAAVRYRTRELRGQRVIYVVDARQSHHFELLFTVAGVAGWVNDDVRLEHVPFGTVLGEDGRPLKTREGDLVKLADLLDEAEVRAAAFIREKSGDIDGLHQLAHAVGIGAVKYADLSTQRIKDYQFRWDRMLSLDGNCGPYLQYAHARMRSILAKAAEAGHAPAASFVLATGEERALALAVLRFGDVLADVAHSLEPHRLTTYLYEVATTFTAFYEACPVLRADSDELRGSRLGLCEVTARLLRTGLGLLGIEAPDRL
jgi:arginyl-tRNA synthetase